MKAKGEVSNKIYTNIFHFELKNPFTVQTARKTCILYIFSINFIPYSVDIIDEYPSIHTRVHVISY